MKNNNIITLTEKVRIENNENRHKMYNNINKPIKDIEPFENKTYLKMISIIKNILNKNNENN